MKVFQAPKDFNILWFSILLIKSYIPDKGYSSSQRL